MKNGIALILLAFIILGSYLYFTKAEEATANLINKTKNSHQPSEPSISGIASEQDKIANINTTNESLQEPLAKKVIKEKEQHSQIPTDIKARLCAAESSVHNCILDIETDFQSHFISENGKLNASEIGAVLTSENFIAFMEKLNVSKTSVLAFERQSQYTDQISIISSNISGINHHQLACDEKMCAINLTTENTLALEEFNKQFFASDNKKGNLFIQQMNQLDADHDNIETRVLFFPGNNNAVRQRL